MATTPPITIAGVTFQFVNDSNYHVFVNGAEVLRVDGSPVVIYLEGDKLADLGETYQDLKEQLAEAGFPAILP